MAVFETLRSRSSHRRPIAGARCLDEAQRLRDNSPQAGTDTKLIRIFGGGVPKGMSRDEARKHGANATSARSSRSAKSHGCTPVLETHDDLGNPARRVLELACTNSIPQDVGVLWDIEHPWRRGRKSRSTPRQRLKRFVRHIHVKDSIGDETADRRCLAKATCRWRNARRPIAGIGLRRILSASNARKRWHEKRAPEPEFEFAAVRRSTCGRRGIGRKLQNVECRMQNENALRLFCISFISAFLLLSNMKRSPVRPFQQARLSNGPRPKTLSVAVVTPCRLNRKRQADREKSSRPLDRIRRRRPANGSPALRCERCHREIADRASTTAADSRQRPDQKRFCPPLGEKSARPTNFCGANPFDIFGACRLF